MINNSKNMPERDHRFHFKRGVTLIVNTFVAPNRQRVVQPTTFCDVTTQLVSVAGSHYTDCDGCVNKLVLSYGEKGADLCSAPYHKLFSDTCNQPAMKRGEDECWWKGGWACIKHAFEPWLGMHVILTGHVEERALEYVCIWTFQGDLVQKHQTKWCFKDLDWGKKRTST